MSVGVDISRKVNIKTEHKILHRKLEICWRQNVKSQYFVRNFCLHLLPYKIIVIHILYLLSLPIFVKKIFLIFAKIFVSLAHIFTVAPNSKPGFYS